jgi:hypothetical protein
MRAAQDSKLLFDLLMDSISTTGYSRISIWREQYVLTINNIPYQAGLCLLRVIFRESDLDTGATVSAIRASLSNLDEWIATNGSDLIAFQAHVKQMLDKLGSRREETQDLMVNLFKAYKVCKDQKFNNYITRIEDQYEEGSLPLTPTQLLNRAPTYYKKRIATPNDDWEHDPINEKLVALEAMVGKIKFKPRTKTKDGTGLKSHKSNQRGAKGRPEWLAKHQKPTTNPNKPKTWNGTPYYYCSPETGGKCDGFWRTHTPKECRGTGRTKQELKSKKRAPAKAPTDLDPAAKKKKKEAALQQIKAHQSILKQMEEEGTDDQGDYSSDEE